jgi:hypothetical protein
MVLIVVVRMVLVKRVEAPAASAMQTVTSSAVVSREYVWNETATTGVK